MYRITAITKEGPAVLSVKWSSVLPMLQKFGRQKIEAFASAPDGKRLYIISPVTGRIVKIKVG